MYARLAATYQRIYRARAAPSRQRRGGKPTRMRRAFARIFRFSSNRWQVDSKLGQYGAAVR